MKPGTATGPQTLADMNMRSMLKQTRLHMQQEMKQEYSDEIHLLKAKFAQAQLETRKSHARVEALEKIVLQLREHATQLASERDIEIHSCGEELRLEQRARQEERIANEAHALRAQTERETRERQRQEHEAEARLMREPEQERQAQLAQETERRIREAYARGKEDHARAGREEEEAAKRRGWYHVLSGRAGSSWSTMRRGTLVSFGIPFFMCFAPRAGTCFLLM